MWVKICGNTNLEDAALAIELGADAVGFIFAASKRQVTAAEVAAIVPQLPAHAERVGVFDSHDREEIAEIARLAGLSAVQLHGGYDEELLVGLGERLGGDAGSVGIIQTLHWVAGDDSAAELRAQLERIARLQIADRVLIDSKVGGAAGGTGVAFDWARAREVFASAPVGLRLVLAGGLRPDNVAQAVGQLHPWGVDVSSGVEASPGRKDPARLAQFLINARKNPTP